MYALSHVRPVRKQGDCRLDGAQRQLAQSIQRLSMSIVVYLGRTVAYLAQRRSIAERMAMSEHARVCRR
jgi:hypothetical protein